MYSQARLVNTFLLPLAISAMWGGMLWSRALLSFATGLYILAALSSGSLRTKWERFRQEPALWGMSVLFVIPLLSGLWSSDRQAWLQVVADKSPLLLFPFCSAALLDLPRERIATLLRLLCGLTVMACLISLFRYAGHAGEVNDSYLRATVMQVAMDNDHVRFAWVLVLQYLFLLFLVVERKPWLARTDFLAAVSCLVFLAIYFHLLAARTGLLGFYLVNMLAVVRYGSRRTKAALALVILLLPLLFVAVFPSFRNRIRFMVWDYQNYSSGGYTEGLSDAPRLMSFRAGAELTREHPLTGTGFGDLSRSLSEWYPVHAPQLKPYERLLPSNEWVLHAAASGLPGALLFTLAVIWPLTRRRKGLLWTGFHVVAVTGFLYEIGLETQYGIFLYAFLSGWIWASRYDKSPPQG
jgi:hypothetical protein